MENHLHFSEEIMALRKGVMREKNIRLFYLPPNSNQLNLLEWLVPNLKENLVNRELTTPEELRDGLEEGLALMRGMRLENCM